MSKTVMAVDDSATIRMMIEQTMKDSGYNLILAENGEDALEKISKTAIDMLITDITMDRMDGIELIRNVRNLSSCKYIPIILLTVENDTAIKMESKRAGATGWLEKPFQEEQLLNIIKKLLGDSSGSI